MTKVQINLQDSFLNQIRKENIPVTIYLINGFQLKGLIRGFDNFTVFLDSDGKQQLVYKHAVSTITPFKTVCFNQGAQEQKNQMKNRYSIKGAAAPGKCSDAAAPFNFIRNNICNLNLLLCIG